MASPYLMLLGLAFLFSGIVIHDYGLKPSSRSVGERLFIGGLLLIISAGVLAVISMVS